MPLHTVKISVRQLVEFILRSGDIDVAYMGANRAAEGTRAHQRVQRKKKAEAKANGFTYESEVFLQTDCAHRDILFHVEGRADGVQRANDGEITVEEIKSTLGAVPAYAPEESHWHWAQAKCYGYMYLSGVQTDGETPRDEETRANPPPPGLRVSLTYCQIETETTRTFSLYFTCGELKSFFLALLEKYHAFAQMDADRIEERNRTAKALPFPYGAYRAGQREMAVAAFAAIKQGRKLFAQAPTGTGKTVSVLFPAVKSLSEGYGCKIFYLTAKTVARQAAEEALRHMTDKGLRMRGITLTAKDKICFCEPRRCDPEYCQYAKGHFDRVNAALLDCLRGEPLLTRPVVENYARKHSVCPSEFQLDLALFCDTVICDYNHVYDPKARLRRFFQYGGDYILLNDEAHNLIDRARDMFSAELYRSDFVSLRRELGKKHPLYKRMGAIAKEILKILKPDGEENGRPALCLNEQPQSLLPLLLDFAAECDAALKALSGEVSPHTEALMNLYFGVLDYLRVSEFFGENYTFFREPSHGFIRLYCLDPSALLAEEQKKSRACVFFSATLTPLPYFRAVLGGAPEDYTLRLASPFPRENLCLLIDRRISTRYKDRAGGYEKIAERLHEMMDGRTGNYMAFFPSYAYLSEVLSIFRERFPHVRTLAQTQEMNDENREGFLAEFLDGPKETLLAFAVMGGIFSEGIDLKGERLTGAAVVGVGLPMITEARNVLMDYYNRLSDTGFAFAYQYPGMNKVLQAAGRVIRTETDKGVVLLIDSRFAESTYRALFPPEWEGFSYIKDGNDLKNKLRDFWASHDGTGGLQGRRSGSPVTHD